MKPISPADLAAINADLRRIFATAEALAPHGFRHRRGDEDPPARKPRKPAAA